MIPSILVYVTQEYGSDRPEYVSMERLRTVKQGAKKTYELYKDIFPEVPMIPLIEATMVAAKSFFEPQEIIAGSPEMLTSEPLYLQAGSDEVHTFTVDLSGLHSGIIFSVILSNSPTDLLGKDSSTILVRNGVTVTAARKLANKKTVWFYHGKPMNDGDMRLHVTIGRAQMPFAYHDGADGRLYVLRDCPVSRLTVDHIGDAKDVPFYVHIYTKDKTVGKKDYKGPVIVRVRDIERKGYVHESVGENECNDFEFEIVRHEDVVGGQDVESAALDGLHSELARLTL